MLVERQKYDFLFQVDDPVSKKTVYTDGSTLVQDLTPDIDKIINLRYSSEIREYMRIAWDKSKNNRAKDLSNENKNPKIIHKVEKQNLDGEMAFLTHYSDDSILSDSLSIESPSPFGKHSSSNTFGNPNMKPIHLFANTDTDEMLNIQFDSPDPCNYVDISDIDKKGR